MDLQVAFKGKDVSTVRISWSPPSLANGIILDYQIHYDGYKTGTKQATVSVYPIPHIRRTIIHNIYPL